MAVKRGFRLEKEKAFLKEIKALSGCIDSNANQAINQLIQCLSDYPDFIFDNAPTIELLNSLAAVVENGFAQADVRTLQHALWAYWLHLFHQRKMDIFFFGNEEHAGFFYQYFDKRALGNFYFIKCTSDEPVSATAFQAQLNESQRPVIIYDHHADRLLSLPEVNSAIAMGDFQEIMFNKAAPFSYTEDTFIAYLQEKHLRLVSNKASTLIVGNSYGYHAFPQKHLCCAVNLSMHSMDLKQAQAMIAHYSDTEHVKEIVMMFGIFDLFYELAKTRTEDNIRVVHILSHYNRLNHIAPHEKSLQPMVERTESEWMAELIPFEVNVPAITTMHQKLDEAEILQKCQEHWEKQKEDTTYLNDGESQINSTQRALLHSKNYKYTLSQQKNKRILQEIVEQAQQNGITVHYVLPPFPLAYREHLHTAMIQENRAFLDTLCSDNFILHDLSAHEDFSRIDFLDGDHINYVGALKIIEQLKKARVHL